jgi:hypothetical protein
MEGYILLFRKLQSNGLWQDKPFSKGQAWVDLLLCASYKAHSFWIRGNEIKVKQGQVAMSTLTMAGRWGWSRGKVRNFLVYLESSQQISQQKSTLTTLITIINWEEYQIKSQQSEQQKANRKPQSKKGKEGKEKTISRFTPPILEDVKAYCKDRGNNVDAEKWFDFYTSKGWMVGRNKMKDWKAAVRTWEKPEDSKPKTLTGCESPELDEVYARATANK